MFPIMHFYITFKLYLTPCHPSFPIFKQNIVPPARLISFRHSHCWLSIAAYVRSTLHANTSTCTSVQYFPSSIAFIVGLHCAALNIHRRRRIVQLNNHQLSDCATQHQRRTLSSSPFDIAFPVLPSSAVYSAHSTIIGCHRLCNSIAHLKKYQPCALNNPCASP